MNNDKKTVYEVRESEATLPAPNGVLQLGELVSTHKTLFAAVRAMPRSGRRVTLVICDPGGLRRLPNEMEMGKITEVFAR